METGMQNLGSGGEAKASPADRDAAETDLARPGSDEEVDQSGRGGTMDAAMAAGMDPTLPADAPDRWDTIEPRVPQVGQGQTAAYGETVENAPGPTAGDTKGTA